MSIRPFVDTFRSVRYGELEQEMADALAALTLACRSTGRAGSITLKLSIKPGKAGQMELSDDVTVALPKLERGTTLMFDTPEGNLQRENPRQQQLPGVFLAGRVVAEQRDYDTKAAS